MKDAFGGDWAVTDVELDSVCSPGGLGLVVRGRVPAAKMPLEASFVRELGLEDVVLGEDTVLGATTPPLKRLRDSHHTLARLLAMGKRPVEVAAITGYCQSRISILQHDPAFAELISFYREKTSEEYIDVHKRIAAVALDATEELHDRILENPETVKTSELLAIATMALDRSGFAPVTRSVNKNLNVNMSAAEMSEMKAALREEITGNVQRINRAALSASVRPDVGGTGDGGSAELCEDAVRDAEEGLHEERPGVRTESGEGADGVE